jgi:hypothetical protein
MNLIHESWATGILYQDLQQGTIKLIPKKADKRRITDWRPLTMLQVVYKLIAKLLAVRLTTYLPLVVSLQQTGFVPGRNILENISIVYLLKDWAEQHQYPTLFLSLDFEIAFDRVNFHYLWQVLTELGLGGSNTSSRIINRSYSQDQYKWTIRRTY